MTAANEDVGPLDRAIVRILHILTDQWSDYTALASTEPAERAIDRMINAGLLQAGGIIAFTQPGIPTRLVLEARWTGRIPMDHVDVLLTAVPEWFDKGKLRAKVALYPSVQRVRLTTEGLVAQGDIRSPQRQHIVLQLLGTGLTEPGRLLVDVQTIERPLPPDARTARE